jgi:HK97 family phage prohead protease
MKKAINTGNLTRFFNLDRSEVDEEARTVNLSFSSEAPVERFFGNEVLSHDPKHVDLGRLNDGAPLLMDHNTSDQIGRVESAMVDGKRGQAVVRFSKSARGSEIFNDVIDGIRQNISVGYRINEMQLDESRSDGDVETFVATNWQPFEVSVVSVPADSSVGISRSAEGENVTTITNFKGEKTMSEEIQKTEPVTAPAAPTVDSGAIARKAVEADRQRSSEIDAITAKHP